ncbi:MAG: flagellar hook protein FlgE [Lachnospiraceae bacterium]|nr:flagellar hook protein FlgE [Lachnospiraceae bacterium]
MLRAMDAAVAGLRAHQNKMDVVGHNIANVNTFGFKAQTYTFKEAMYQTSTSSTGGTDVAAGANAAQFGYGALMGTIGMDMTASTPTYVGGFNATISGDGFFMVKSTKNPCAAEEEAIKGNDFYYTRVGQFSLDSNGYVVDGDKNFVYGFMMNEDGTLNTDELVPLRMPASVDVDPVTGEVTANFDNQGSDEVVLSKEITINAAGEIVSKFEYDRDTEVTKNTNRKTTASHTADDLKDTNKWIQQTDPTTGKLISVWQNANDATEFIDKNGYIMKQKEDSTGAPIPGQYEKEKEKTSEIKQSTATVSLGKVAIATFQNPNGMTKAGGNYYTTTDGDNAGKVAAGIAGGANPDLMTGYVEASNVDLSKEFADMITTHRGFQSNTKMITVSDEMLSDLVAMKR